MTIQIMKISKFIGWKRKSGVAFSLLFLSMFSFTNAQTSLIGMTQNGGTGGGFNGGGTSFNINLGTGFYTSSSFIPSSTGVNPGGSYFKASNGNIYGLVRLTSSGFIQGNGYMVQYNPNTGIITPMFQFTGAGGAYMGSKPYGSLIEANPGVLYGMTYLGGTNNEGVIFSYTLSSGTYSVLYNFSSNLNGGNKPRGSLFKASNGLLYGTTSLGGSSDNGVAFSFNLSTNAYTELFSFSGTTGSYMGTAPEGDMIEPAAGVLYGMAPYGGTNDEGVLYSYNISTAAYTVKYNFSSITGGANPEGSLIKATNGKLYGLSSLGGVAGEGVLFEFNTAGAGTYSTVLEFSGSTGPYMGSFPYGSLLQASNGNLYGMTFNGGSLNKGVVFGYNLTTAAYSVLADFSGTTGTTLGGNPTYGSLIEITSVCPYPSVTSSQFTDVSCNGGNDGSAMITAVSSGTMSYNWMPAGGTTGTASNLTAGVYTCAITNVCGTTTETITISEPPVLTLNISSATGTNICSGSTASLTANSGGGSGWITYTWTGGSNNFSITVSPSVTTTYTVDILDGNNCALSETISISVSNSPTVTAMSNASILCSGQTASLTAGGASSYVWSNSSTGAVIAVSPTVTTIYTVTGTAANGCTSTAVVTQSVSTCTGIESLVNNNSVIVYPNPFLYKVNIETSAGNSIEEILVFNTLGKLVYSVKSNDSKVTLNLEALPSGIYFLKYRDGIKKVVKE